MILLDLLERYQGLVGVLVTLGAAFMGFTGVIYSQRKLMAMAETERQHQERLVKEQATELRKSEFASFLNAILGELSSLQDAVENAINILVSQIAVCDEVASSGTGRKTQPRLAFRFATPVFDSHVGKIGLLAPKLSYEVSSVYGRYKGFSTQAQDQVPEMDSALAARIMRSVEASLKQLSAATLSLKQELNATLQLPSKP